MPRGQLHETHAGCSKFLTNGKWPIFAAKCIPVAPAFADCWRSLSAVGCVPEPPVVTDRARTLLLQTSVTPILIQTSVARAYTTGGSHKRGLQNKTTSRSVAKPRALIHALCHRVCRVCGPRRCYKQSILARALIWHVNTDINIETDD